MNYLNSCCGGNSFPCNNYCNYYYNCGRRCHTANGYYNRGRCYNSAYGCYGSGSIKGGYPTTGFSGYGSLAGFGLGCSSCGSI